VTSQARKAALERLSFIPDNLLAITERRDADPESPAAPVSAQKAPDEPLSLPVPRRKKRHRKLAARRSTRKSRTGTTNSGEAGALFGSTWHPIGLR
jgi:hypothetical protein